jgi:hypothetical protein
LTRCLIERTKSFDDSTEREFFAIEYPPKLTFKWVNPALRLEIAVAKAVASVILLYLASKVSLWR